MADMNSENWANNPFILGQHIRTARKAQHLTQEELSERARISRRHISDIENGIKGVGSYTLFKVLNALNIALYVGIKPLPLTCEELEEEREKEFQENKKNGLPK